MPTLQSLFRSFLIRSRWLLLVFYLMLAALAIIPMAVRISPVAMHPLTTSILIAAALVMVLVLSLTIQTHGYAGSNYFWMAKPIKPRTLAGSQFLFLLALVLAPLAIVQWISWGLLDATWKQVGEGMAAWLWFLRIGVIAACVFICTRRLVGGLLVLVVASALAVFTFTFITPIIVRTNLNLNLPVAVYGPVMMVVPLAMAIGAVWWRLRRREGRGSVAILVSMGFLIPVLSTILFPMSHYYHLVPGNEIHTDEIVSLRILDMDEQLDYLPRDGEVKMGRVVASRAIAEAPPDHFATPNSLSFQMPNGEHFSTHVGLRRPFLPRFTRAFPTSSTGGHTQINGEWEDR